MILGDVVKSHSPRRILFDHVPKTGGMTIHEVLKRKLGDAVCSPILNTSFSSALGEFERYDCVSGHIQYHPMSSLDGLWAFTVLRHPVERILSQYYFSRSAVAPSGNPFNEAARRMDLDALVDTEDPSIRPSLSNVMVAHFSLLMWDGITETTPATRLEMARHALSKFNLVGLTERLAETVDLLCWHLGAGPVDTLPRVNANDARIPLGEVSTATRRKLAELNELDMQLYTSAQQIYDRQRKRVIFASAGDFDMQETSRRVAPEVVAPPPESGLREYGTRKIEIRDVQVLGSIILGPMLLGGEQGIIRIAFASSIASDDLTVGIRITDATDRLIFGTNTRSLGYELRVSESAAAILEFEFTCLLGVGDYWLGVSLHPGAEDVVECHHRIDHAVKFQVAGNIGWPFEGVVKLTPQVRITGEQVQLQDRLGEALGPLQQLGRHAPVLQDHACVITLPPSVAPQRCGEIFALLISIFNSGTERWWAATDRCVRISYHWADVLGNVRIFDGERTALPADLLPGQSTHVWMTVRAPDLPGRYRLQVALVQEHAAWFDAHGVVPEELTIDVLDEEPSQPRTSATR